MKEKITLRILAVILFLIWVGGIVLWLLFWWTIWLVLSVFIFWMATFFAFLRLWWNIWNSWDKWIHVWIGVFMLAFCWIFATIALEGFTSNDGFVFGVVFVIAFLLLFIWVLYQVWLLKISNNGVKTLILIFEWVLSVIWVIAFCSLLYYLIG